SSAGAGSTGTWTGDKNMTLPFSALLLGGPNYYFGAVNSSASAVNTGPFRLSQLVMTNMTNASWGAFAVPGGASVTNSSVGPNFIGANYGTTSGALPNTIAFSGLSNMVSNAQPYVEFLAS